MLSFLAWSLVLPAAFRDVSLEQRCEALSGYVLDYAEKHLAKGLFQSGFCGEGNGLGGARYTFDFKLKGHAYRLDLAYLDHGAADVRLCDIDAAPAACSLNKPAAPLVFESRPARFDTAEKAAAAARLFTSTDPGAKGLVPAVAAWAAGKQTQHQVYGMDYDAFVKEVLAWKGGFPLSSDGKTGKVQLHLEPLASGSASTGKVRFDAPVDAALLACFKCADLKCLNDGVRYRFDDRFFALTRTLPDGAGETGAGWVIEGKTPPEWSYSCGVSRYSLQKIK